MVLPVVSAALEVLVACEVGACSLERVVEESMEEAILGREVMEAAPAGAAAVLEAAAKAAPEHRM